jgi:hypothetical protein
MSLGNLHISLINTTVLRSILRNLSLQLPENYELVAGTRFEKMYLCYEAVSVTVMGKSHFIKVLMSVPLKTADSYFALYSIIAFPTRFSDD